MRKLLMMVWLMCLVAHSWTRGAELKILSPQDYQVVQRQESNRGTIRIMGEISESVSHDAFIEARLSDAGEEVPWQRIDAIIAGREVSAQLTAQAGGWQRLEVRVANAQAVVASAAVEHIGVGEIFVVAGQSNSANYGEEKLTPHSNRVVAFDGFKWQIANDPQPGAKGRGGSFMPAFGDALVSKLNVPIGIVACGVGGTSVREWLPKGARFSNPPTIESRVEKDQDGQWVSKGEAYETLIQQMKVLGPGGFRAVLWHQGESDANQKDPTRTLAGNFYREYLETIIRDSRQAIGWEVPWIVAQATYHLPGDESSPDIRQAQASLWADKIAVEGPDTDTLTGDFRERDGQGVHLSAKGLRVHGQMWADKVTLWLGHLSQGGINVQGNFEGGNVQVVRLDQLSQTVRIMPKLIAGRGWPCWWSLQVKGLQPSTVLTLEVQAQTQPYRGNTVLANSWCQPKHAWASSDGGATWTPTPAGKLNSDKVMTYAIPVLSSEMSLAWGPPFVASDADKLLQEIAGRIASSQRFELAKTRAGRSVGGIRIGPENANYQVWVNARQHAWESGSSHVGRGFIEWVCGDDPAAITLRQRTCIYFIPIMDVDNVTLGAGGKDSYPRDHNRDWADNPIYPEVAAAQKMIRAIHEKHGLDTFIDLHNPGSNDPVFFFGPFGYEEYQGVQRQNYQRWLELATQNIREPTPIFPEYRFANYVATAEERGRMSSGWVGNCIGNAGISLTLETGWNNLAMSAEGYGSVGAGLAKTLAEYLSNHQ